MIFIFRPVWCSKQVKKKCNYLQTPPCRGKTCSRWTGGSDKTSFLLITCSGAFFHSFLDCCCVFFPPEDINLAGEPKPHRSKTVKRSAGDMYRCVRTDSCSQQHRNHVIRFGNAVLHKYKCYDKLLLIFLTCLCSVHSSSVDLDYDFQRDYYDR